MKKILRAICLCLVGTLLFACANNNVAGLSPMLSLSLDNAEIAVYEDYDTAKLNQDGTTPSELLSSLAVSKARLELAYDGELEYKASISTRVDEIETEQDGSMGHNITSYGVKSRVAVIFYADETWFEGRFGANAASGGDTLFDERYLPEGHEHFSLTRRALLLNSETVKDISPVDFYLVGLSSGYYVVNFFIEAADFHGHFHGINKIAIASVVLTVVTGEDSGGN